MTKAQRGHSYWEKASAHLRSIWLFYLALSFDTIELWHALVAFLPHWLYFFIGSCGMNGNLGGRWPGFREWCALFPELLITTHENPHNFTHTCQAKLQVPQSERHGPSFQSIKFNTCKTQSKHGCLFDSLQGLENSCNWLQILKTTDYCTCLMFRQHFSSM